MTDREAFAQTIRQCRQKGARDLLSTGIVIDDVLVRELREEGSDQRCGVNVVGRPSCEIVDRITELQRRLTAFEPDQYYYPAEDLHLTVVEICHSRTPADAERIAAAAKSLPPQLFAPEPAAEFDAPTFAYDTKGAALNFLPRDGRLQQLRNAIPEELARTGVLVESRYLPNSAHITFLRYTTPLRTPLERWVEILNDCAVPVETSWVLSQLWLTWGASWYGMHNRISKFALNVR